MDPRGRNLVERSGGEGFEGAAAMGGGTRALTEICVTPAELECSEDPGPLGVAKSWDFLKMCLWSGIHGEEKRALDLVFSKAFSGALKDLLGQTEAPLSAWADS